MSDAIESFNVKGLEKLLKALQQKPPVCRVGILGATPHKSKDGQSGSTNAEIGAAHEFGTHTIPRRSFLRMPVSDGLQSEMNNSGLLDEQALKEVIKTGSVIPWLEKVAICAEAVISDAFATGGGGKWPPHAPGYTNNTGDLLVDTGQLRDSILSDVDGSIKKRGG